MGAMEHLWRRFFSSPPSSRQLEDVPFILERSGRVREGSGIDGKSWVPLPVKRTAARKSSRWMEKSTFLLFVSLGFVLETSSVGAERECRNCFITLFPTRGHESLPRTPSLPPTLVPQLLGRNDESSSRPPLHQSHGFLLATSCLASGRLQDNFLATFSKYSCIYILCHGPGIYPVINCHNFIGKVKIIISSFLRRANNF